MSDKDILPENDRGATDPYEADINHASDFHVESADIDNIELSTMTPDAGGDFGDLEAHTPDGAHLGGEAGSETHFSDMPNEASAPKTVDYVPGEFSSNIRMPGAAQEPTTFDENLFGTNINEPTDQGTIPEPDFSFAHTDDIAAETSTADEATDYLAYESDVDAAMTHEPSVSAPTIDEPFVSEPVTDEPFIDAATANEPFVSESISDSADIEQTTLTDGYAAESDTSIPELTSAADAASTQVFNSNDMAFAQEPAITDPDMVEDGSTNAGDSGDGDDTNKRKKWPWIVAVLVLLALIGAAIGYYLYYKDRGLPGTYVGSVSVSGLKSSEIKAELAKAESSTKVTLAGDVDNKEFKVNDLGTKLNIDKSVEKALKPNKSFLSYIKAPFTTVTIDPAYNVDRDVTDTLASELSNDAPTKVDPVEPSVVLAEDTGEFSVKDGEDGKGVSGDDLEAVGIKALKSLKSTSTDIKYKAVSPRYTVEDLKPIAEQANKMAAQPVTLTVGSESATPGKPLQATWVKLPKLGSKDKPTIEPSAVNAWVEEEAQSISRTAKPGMEYVNQAGEVLLVGEESVDGVKVNNIKETTDNIVSSIEDGKDFSSELKTEVVKATVNRKVIADGAQNLPYMAAPGEKWIDINVSGHLLTPYVGAEPAHAPFPIVGGAAATPTVRGEFRVYSKLTSQTMRGPGYETPGVPWIMYFHGGYAIHGAYWRSAFGPGVPGGSHGCVNMRIPDAKWMYDWAPMGTVVKSR